MTVLRQEQAAMIDELLRMERLSGLSTAYRGIAGTRVEIPPEEMVRPEGVADEFAQVDFG